MLEVFYLTAKKLNIIQNSSFIISNMSYYYEYFLKKYPNFEDDYNVLKEWEIQSIAKLKKNTVINEDLKKLHYSYCDIDNTNYTKFFDRRFILGENSKFQIEYKRTLSNTYMDNYVFHSFKEV